MVDHFSDQELTTLFQKHLPHKPLPPDLADRLKQQVLAAVATTLHAAPRPAASMLPPEASPAIHFVAEQPDEQALYDLFQQHLRHGAPSPELAVHLQQRVAAAVGPASPATRTAPTPKPTRRQQSQTPVESPGARWATWLNRLHHLLAHPPALALGGITSVLVLMLVLISLNRTPGRPAARPVKTAAPISVTSMAPSVMLPQAHVTITNGQAMIQKPSGQIETVTAGTTIHGLAPGDRLITGQSTARIEYFPGQSTTVEPGAEVELQEYAAAGTITRVALLVHSGKTSHEVNTPLAETDLFEIRTPAAVASAKYTKLTVEVLSETQTHIETEAGTAQVTTDDKEVVIAAGQQMTATTDTPWSMAPLSVPTIEAVASPLATLTTPPTPTPTNTATAITLLHPSEPLRPTSTPSPDEAALHVPAGPIPAPRETAGATPTSTPLWPTITATPVVPPYMAILVPTATATALPDTPTVAPTGTTAIINTVEPSTTTPTPVDTTTPTDTPLPSTRTLTPTAMPTHILVPTATTTSVLAPTSTQTATPTGILVPTASKTPVPLPTATATNILVPTATATDIVVPTATKMPAPTQTAVPTATKTPAPTYTATATNIPVLSPTATNTAVPAPTVTNTAEVLPTATNTRVTEPTATETPEPTFTPTDTPVPLPTATDTPEPLPTATDTPLPSPTATDTATPEPTFTSTDTPEPSTTATDTPEPTPTPTDTPIPQ